jgi:hypothetical protein
MIGEDRKNAGIWMGRVLGGPRLRRLLVWFGRHVDAGRRLYFLPLAIALCLCGSIASDRWVGGSNMHDMIRRKVFGNMTYKVWKRMLDLRSASTWHGWCRVPLRYFECITWTRRGRQHDNTATAANHYCCLLRLSSTHTHVSLARIGSRPRSSIG